MFKQRRFSAAGMTDKRDELALRNREIDVSNGGIRAFIGLKRLADALEFERNGFIIFPHSR
jgi:hypothetical protein